jgi:hypothetical protein
MRMTREAITASVLLGVTTMCGVMGCSSTTMRTARQLEAGDIVVSGGLDEPGFLYVPRVSGQVMYGIGLGDLSVHGGTTIVTFNGGLGGRFYLGERWNAGLQLDANGILGNTGDVDFSGLYSGTLQVTTAARKQYGFYGGFHLAGHTSADGDRNFEPPVFNAGVLAGLDMLLADNLGIQLEARLAPLAANANGVGVFPFTTKAFEGDAAGLFVGQVGFSLYKRWAATPSIEGSVVEDRWNDPDNDFKAVPATRPRSSTPIREPSTPAAPPLPEPADQGEGSAPVPPPPE